MTPEQIAEADAALAKQRDPERVAKLSRKEKENLAALIVEWERRKERWKHEAPGGLIHFIKYFWSVLEPNKPFVDGWVLHGMCDHLEAISRGQIFRLLINVSPGSMKSLLVNTFWPAYEWAALNKPDMRYLSFSYAAHLTERDNGRMRDLIRSKRFQAMYGSRFSLTKEGLEQLRTDKTGWKLAASIGGIGSGERGDRVLLDDPHNVHEGESKIVREKTVLWFQETMSNRLNDLEKSAIVVIMQRVHDEDVSGKIISEGNGYVHYCVPMEFDPKRKCKTKIGWEDPRTIAGELAWPERFTAEGLAEFKKRPYMWAGQYNQSPQVRGGNIFKYEWWQKFEVLPGRGFNQGMFDYVVGSLDTAYTKKTQNDPSAMTVWGCYIDRKDGATKVMLMAAWEKHLDLHGLTAEQKPGEPYAAWVLRTKPDWGLVEWVTHTCRTFRVNRLLIESTAAGHPTAQEITRLVAKHEWATQLMPPKGDKENRAHAVTHLFTDGLVYAPGEFVDLGGGQKEWEFRKFAQHHIETSAKFPKGRDDLVDAMTQALRHLRDINALARRAEVRDAALEEREYKRDPQPLYPGSM